MLLDGGKSYELSAAVAWGSWGGAGWAGKLPVGGPACASWLGAVGAGWGGLGGKASSFQTDRIQIERKCLTWSLVNSDNAVQGSTADWADDNEGQTWQLI